MEVYNKELTVYTYLFLQNVRTFHSMFMRFDNPFVKPAFEELEEKTASKLFKQYNLISIQEARNIVADYTEVIINAIKSNDDAVTSFENVKTYLKGVKLVPRS